MTGLLTRRWELVNSLSSATFTVRNLGIRTVRGQVPIRHGWVDVDSSGRPTAVTAELDLAGLATGNARRDRDLRKPHLLDSDRFPTLAFTGRHAEAHDGDWQLPGRLAAHGAEIDLVLSASVRRDDERVAVHAVTSFDRLDLGVRAPRFLIGRRITVTLDVVLRPVV